MALDINSETFVIYVIIRKQEKIVIDLIKKAQIKAQNGAQSGAQVKALIFNKAFIKVLAEYSDYSNVFLAENAAELSENTRINEHAIKLKEDKQPPFGPIYNLGPLQLKVLKTYIETNLVNGFICSFKSPVGAPILFDRKLNESLYLCVDYWSLNNITIKN